MRKKIFIIILNITKAGGTERAVINLANMLKLKYDVTILSLLSNGMFPPYFDIGNNIIVEHLSIEEIPSKKIQKIKWQVSLFLKISKIMDKGSIVIGTGHNINVILPFLKGYKRIACEHIQLDSIPCLHRIAMRLLYPLNDSLVVLSQSASEKFKKYNKNLRIIPNTLSFVPSISSSLSEKRIIMVGRFSKEKGYDRIVNIASFIKNEHPEWSIHIFGSGPLQKEMENLYSKKNLGKWIIIHEPVKNIQDEYLNSSIYIMTSYNEALPMVLLEAKSCGLPVVAYECEGTKSLILNNYDGFIIKNEDVKDFNDKLNILINNIDIRKQMGRNACDSCKPFDFNVIFNAWMELIKSIQ